MNKGFPIQVILAFVLLLSVPHIYGQDIDGLMKKVRAKLELVNDYRADGQLKTDVPFMKIPESKVSVYYKKPNKFKIRKEEGISIVPKGGINLNSLFSGNEYAMIAGGTSTVRGQPVVVLEASL